MSLIEIDQSTRSALIALAESEGIWLEGDLVSKVSGSSDSQFEAYLEEARKLNEKKVKSRQDSIRSIASLKDRLKRLESGQGSESSLDLLQKKTKFRMMESIIKTALIVILAVGGTATILYILAMFTGKDTELIGNTWSNLLGILLTNSFSIVGTIMGVRYSQDNNDDKND